MTENEAIKLGKELYKNITSNANNIIPTKEYIEFVAVAIQALEEVQQYRAIGTVEECRTAVKKMKPKRPKGISINEDNLRVANCPNCGKFIMKIYSGVGCNHCLQRLDWTNK